MKQGKNVGIYTKKWSFIAIKMIITAMEDKRDLVLIKDLTHMIPLLFAQAYDL